MVIYGNIIGLLWLFFILYWIVSASSVKKDVYRRGSWWQRTVILVAVIIVFANFIPVWRQPLFPSSAALGTIAVIVTAAGIGFAIWARRHLGANWSSQPSLKEGHELVTSGPYRLVRHPIYTGIIFAFIGTALIDSALWGVILLFVTVMFIRRVYVEDGLMTRQFPDQYPEYKKRTKALIPFVW